MTDHKEHSLTPSPELVRQWADIWHKAKVKHIDIGVFVATQAANWGADQELEACCKWLNDDVGEPYVSDLRAARRHKPLSLKQKALEEVAGAVAGGNITPERGAHIRLALELIPDDL